MEEDRGAADGRVVVIDLKSLVASLQNAGDDVSKATQRVKLGPPSQDQRFSGFLGNTTE